MKHDERQALSIGSVREGEQPATGFVQGTLYDEEMLQAWRLYHLLIHLLGGPLPTDVHVRGGERVLDVQCRLGVWAIELAARHPSLAIIGIDHRSAFIKQAYAVLPTTIKNVTYHVQNPLALNPALFAPTTFDLVHLQFCLGDFTFAQFAPLIATLTTLLRPGGILIWTEADIPATTSTACDTLAHCLPIALEREGRAFGEGTAHALGHRAWMQHWMTENACILVSATLQQIQVHAKTRTHTVFSYYMQTIAERIAPLLLRTRVLTQPQYDGVLQRFRQDLQASTFQAICPIYTVVAKKEVRKEASQALKVSHDWQEDRLLVTAS